MLQWPPILAKVQLHQRVQVTKRGSGTFVGTYEIFLSNDIIRNRTGFFYVGVGEVNGSLDHVAAMVEDSAVNLTESELSRVFSTNYSLRIFTSGCYFYNYDLKIWSGAGCFVHDANKDLTFCKCNHLTSFGGGFFVMPNTVDFSYVFANAGFADNITIYMTIIVTLSLFLGLLFWARAQDKKDAMKMAISSDLKTEQKSGFLLFIFSMPFVVLMRQPLPVRPNSPLLPSV
ncbi:hypothetical protein LAZ67_2002889 [Cordylochernes scorpioides]|uniref:GPS domain-containing protein n=1 Tax=Cordylochernes scorpioides TaxID=51811 RepID=A0ABY6K2C1_9ARAC|nr:hypothetical protein LAZ67_2002889 [Cordylochernes scorpioides]